MTLKLARHRQRQRPPASVLMEAVLATGIAMTALAFVVPLWKIHRDYMRTARDIDLLEALVIKDVNTFRQFAGQWKVQSGPYSGKILDKKLTTTLADPLSKRGSTTYEAGDFCWIGGNLEFQFTSDLDKYKTYFGPQPHLAPYTVDLKASGEGAKPEFKQVPGYVLKREVLVPTNFDPANPDGRTFTIRLNYVLEKAPGADVPDLSFRRVADVQVEAQYGC